MKRQNDVVASLNHSETVLVPRMGGRYPFGSLVVSVVVHGVIFMLVGAAILVPGTSLIDSFPKGEVLKDEFLLENTESLDDEHEMMPVQDSSEDGAAWEVGDLGLEVEAMAAESGLVPPGLLIDSRSATLTLPSGLVAGGFFGGEGVGQGSGGGTGKGGGKGGRKFFGLEMGEGNAGLLVYLDGSGSMDTVAQKIGMMVAAEFPQAKVIRVQGGLFAEERSLDRLERQRKGEDYIVKYYRGMLPGSVIPQTRALVGSGRMRPEAIYMVSDFADFMDPQVMLEFGRYLVEQKIRFNAHCVGEKPPPALANLCRVTGGALLMLTEKQLEAHSLAEENVMEGTQ